MPKQKIAALEVAVHHSRRVQELHCHRRLRGPAELLWQRFLAFQLLAARPQLVPKGAAHAFHEQAPLAVQACHPNAAKHQGRLQAVTGLESKRREEEATTSEGASGGGGDGTGHPTISSRRIRRRLPSFGSNFFRT